MVHHADPLPELTAALLAHHQRLEAHWSGRSYETGCVRCGADHAAGSDFCGGCRAFLLEETDDDPALSAAPPAWLASGDRELAELLREGQLHILTEAGRTLSGSEAVAHIARLSGVDIPPDLDQSCS